MLTRVHHSLLQWQMVRSYFIATLGAHKIKFITHYIVEDSCQKRPREKLRPLTNIYKEGRHVQPKLVDINSAIEAVYPYHDNSGTVVIEKVRKKGKKFTIRRPLSDGSYVYQDATKNLTIPLYNLPEILQTNLIIIVEGEKDVETLRTHGLIATCNFDGGGKWRDHYNETLKGKDLIILPDNDKTGSKHANLLIQNLKFIANSIKVVNLSGLEEKGDVTDYLTVKSLDELKKEIEETPFLSFTQQEKTKEDKTRKAHYQDYVNLFEEVLGTPKRDIFSVDLHFPNEFDQWEPAFNALEILASEAATKEDNAILKFKTPLIKSHLAKFERTKEPELLINIPDWDGQDRIKTFAEALVRSSDRPLTTDDFDALR